MSLLSLHLWMDTSSCFLVLVMVNSAAVNMGCRYLFEVFNFSRYLSKSEITVVLGVHSFFFFPPAICTPCVISLP